jgi:hypothetical protein
MENFKLGIGYLRSLWDNITRKSQQFDTNTTDTGPFNVVSRKRKAEYLPEEEEKDRKAKRLKAWFELKNSNFQENEDDMDDIAREDIDIKGEEAFSQIDSIDQQDDKKDFFIPVEKILAPQEKFLLRSDPWNQTLNASTWSNDTTLLIVDTTSINSINYPNEQYNGELLGDNWRAIFTYFDPIEMARFSLVSKWHKATFDNMPANTWKNYFYQRKWKLPHELMNFNMKNEINEIVIRDDKIDWFNEVKRNYFNDKRIGGLIQEITTKIQTIVRFFQPQASAEELQVFHPGLSDRKLDKWEEKNKCYLTNDLRSLFKYCNGWRWELNQKADINYQYYIRLHTTNIPSIHEVSPSDSISIKRLEVEDDDDRSDKYTLELNPKPLQLSCFVEEDFLSDSSDYEPSKLSKEYSEEEISTRSEGKDAKKELDYKVWYFSYGGANLYSSDEEDIQYYDPIGGGIINCGADATDNDCLGDVDAIGTIVDLLQNISDYLDDEKAPLWIKSDTFKLKNVSVFTEEFEALDAVEKDEFEELVSEISHDFGTDLYFHRRAVSLVTNAAKQFLIDIFTKAQSLETKDALQPDTLITTANQTKFYNAKFNRQTKDDDHPSTN